MYCILDNKIMFKLERYVLIVFSKLFVYFYPEEFHCVVDTYQ